MRYFHLAPLPVAPARAIVSVRAIHKTWQQQSTYFRSCSPSPICIYHIHLKMLKWCSWIFFKLLWHFYQEEFIVTMTLVVISTLCSSLKMFGVVRSLCPTRPTPIDIPAYHWVGHLTVLQCSFTQLLNTASRKQQKLLLHLALEQSLRHAQATRELTGLCQLSPAECRTSNSFSVHGLPSPGCLLRVSDWERTRNST